MIPLKNKKKEQSSSELLSKKLMKQSEQLKKENQELRKAHKELKTLFENINEVFYSVDMVSYKLVQMSAACEKVYGYTAEEFFADDDLWQNVIHPDDKEISQQQVQILNQGKQVLNQYRIIHKDKSIRWIENKITSTLDEKGRLIQIDGVSNDITDRKIAEKKLGESVSILEATIESTADGILVADLNGKIIRFNKKFVELWHIPGEILETKDDNKAINYVLDQLTDPEKFLFKLRELQNRPKDISFDILEFKDGRVFERYSQPQLINGECAGRVWSFRDITKRKSDEEALKESESQLALATKIAKLGYWEFDALKDLFTFNDQFYSLFKTTAEKVGGYIMAPERYSGLFVFPDDRNFVNAEIARTIGALESGFNNKIEHRIIFGNGEVGWISVNFFLIKNDEGVTIKTFGVNQDITDQKKAEEALSNNELRFRTLTSNAPVGIFQTDVDGNISYVNETWLRYSGLEMNEALGDSWTATVHPDDRKELIEEWNTNSKMGIKSSSEYRLIDKKGNTKWVSGEAIPLFNNTQEITGYIGTVSDITERKKADEALRLAQFTIENTTHAIYWIKSDGSFHMVNNAATQMLGFTFEELMQLNVPGIDPFYNKDVWDGFWQAIINQKFMRLITKHIRKDGTLIDVQIDTHYFKFENQEMSCAFVSDITERKIAETLLSASEEKYRQIVETAQEGIWMINENNYISFVNKKMCEIFKYPEEEMIGKDIFYFMQDDWKEEGFKGMERRKKGIIEDLDFSFITKTGEPIWVNLSANPVFDIQGKYCGALAMVSDITEKKLLQQKLLEHKVQQQRNITKAVVGAQEKERAEIGAELHDNVNQLLAASQLLLGYGLTQGKCAPSLLQGMEYLNTAMDEVRKLSHALVGPSQNENIGLIESVQELAESISMVTDIKIRFDHYCFNEEEYEPGLKIVIYRIIQEQTNNILKYASATEVVIELRKEVSSLLLHVNDNGKGFDTTTIRHGIGLKNISNRAHIYNGTVHILSSPGNGCKMKIVFKTGC